MSLIFVLCLVVFRPCCYVSYCKMNCYVWNSDLAGGEGPKKARKPLNFGREDLRVDSASRLDGENEDHETSSLKDVLRRMLQEMQRNKAKKKMKTWIIWKAGICKQRSATGFRVGIVHRLTSKPLRSVATQFPDRMLVVRSQDYDHQTGPFHPVCLVHHVFGE